MNPTDYTVEYWQRVRSINLDGTWYFSQAVATPMRERRRGKIVNFGSSAGILANPHQAPYCVAKHGIVGITRAMAVDLGSYQINVNCVSPTTVETPLGLRSTTPEFRAKMAEQIPLGRLGKVSDMVDAVLFLASPRADFITGVTLPVDGGLTLSHTGMSEIVKRLHTSIVLPMHRRGRPLSQFITMMGEDFETDYRLEDGFTVSLRTLPRRPTIIVLQGV